MLEYMIAFVGLALVAAIHIRIRDMEADTSSVGCADSFHLVSTAHCGSLVTNVPPAHLLNTSSPSRGSLTGKEENANV